MIVVCGEALVDLVPLPPAPGVDPAAEGTEPDAARGGYAARPGGSPLNVAVGLGRLGTPVALLSRLSGDAFGRRLADHVHAAGVDTGWSVAAAEPTTLAVVTLDDEGRADYSFYVDGAADGGWRPDELPSALPEGAAVHVSGSLALGVPAMGDTLEALLRREHGRRVLTLDPNVRPALARDEADLRARLDRWLALVDLVKISSDDLAWVAPGEAVESVAERWAAAGPALVVVTRGPDGVHARGPAGTVDLPGRSVDVVDTVGAGDAFMSGLLCALDEDGDLTPSRLARLDRDGLSRALDLAQDVAAETCRRHGADPPWRAQLPVR